MKRLWHHYETWEDWRAGMFREIRDQWIADDLTRAAAGLLGNPPALESAMRYVAFHWPHAADQNLSNPSRNKQAWLGQAACCHAVGAPELLTKLAWWTLSVEQRTAANMVADRVLAEWREARAETPTGV